MKNIIGILGIVLPALIILLGITRVFMNKTKGVNGLMMLFAILLLITGFLQYFVFYKTNSGTPEGPKQLPIGVSKHSAAFNQSVEKVLSSYYRMTDGFVNNDVAAVNLSATEMKMELDSLKIDELKVDTLIYETALQPFGNTKAEISSIIADPSMEEKRGSLNIFSNELYSLLRTVRYDLAKLYWKECPFAFGEDRPGNWLSKTEEMSNPYDKKNCAEIKSTINFMPADTVLKAGQTKEE